MNNNNGTFVAVRFREDTVRLIHEYTLMNGIPNPLDPSEYHSTIVYSRNPLLFLKPEHELVPVRHATPIAFDVFEGVVNGKKGNCCVLKIDSQYMTSRHEYLRMYHNATHDFPSYKPHVTLSYDIGDFDVSKLRDISVILPKLYIVSEFNEELEDVGSPNQKEESQ
jgi:hypothetical protein